MTDAKHTPGPWTVNRNGNVVDRHEMRVATPDGADIEQMEANAQLIAAGPDLLALAELIADPNQITTGITGKSTIARWQHIARAVVAKARGEA